MQLDLEIAGVAQEIERLVRSRAGRLVAVTVGAPRGMELDLLVARLQGQLQGSGYDGVRVQAVPDGPRLRLINLEFAR